MFHIVPPSGYGERRYRDYEDISEDEVREEL
jgi:hypothetical protein